MSVQIQYVDRDTVCRSAVVPNCQLFNNEFKNDKMKHNNTVNPTTQIGRYWSNVTPRSFWPMSWNRSISYHQKYLKNAF